MTTAAQIIQYLREATISVPPERVVYGYVELLNVTEGSPTVTLGDFVSKPVYGTCGIRFETSNFTLLVTATSLEEAESVALEVDAIVNLHKITDDGIMVFREHYDIIAIEDVKRSYKFQVGLYYVLNPEE